MTNQYHILNGDALKNQFPKELKGNIIIARECLVDGPLNGKTPKEFYKTRAKFLNENYVECSYDDYLEKSASEFKKITEIPADAEINLWFEDDLFCQVNFWYMLHLLYENKRKEKIYLVRPKDHTRYGFGGLSKLELLNIFAAKIEIENIDELAKLWTCYKSDLRDELLALSTSLHSPYPFLKDAVKAHLDRIPTQNSLGKPKESLKLIMQELGTTSFGPVFNAFCERNPIYGFGDSQVRRLYNELINKPG